MKSYNTIHNAPKLCALIGATLFSLFGTDTIQAEERLKFATASYDMSGTLNKSFSQDGKVTDSFQTSPAYAWARDVAVDGEGRSIVVGQADGHFALTRYLANGDIDTSFGNKGRVMTTIGGSSEARSVALGLSGSIYVAGVSGNQAVITKYNSNGALNLSWGDNGVAKPHIPEKYAYETSQANAIAVYSGRVFVAGSFRKGYSFGSLSHLSQRSMFYVELDASGNNSWGLDKIDVFPNQGDGAYQEEIANDLVVDPQNAHLYVIGQATRSTQDPKAGGPVTLISQAVVARLNLFIEKNYPALAIDTSYGNEVTFNPNGNDLPNGDGLAIPGNLSASAIVQYDDPYFTGKEPLKINAAALDSNGGLILGGRTTVNGVHRIMAASVGSNGSGAMDLGTGGFGVYPGGSEVMDLVVLDDDCVVVAGWAQLTNQRVGVLQKFHVEEQKAYEFSMPIPVADGSFGYSGTVITSFHSLKPTVLCGLAYRKMTPKRTTSYSDSVADNQGKQIKSSPAIESFIAVGLSGVPLIEVELAPMSATNLVKTFRKLQSSENKPAMKLGRRMGSSY